MIILVPASLFLASFMLIWAFNLSFTAHLQEDGKAMRRMHVWSFIIVVMAVGLIWEAAYFASR